MAIKKAGLVTQSNRLIEAGYRLSLVEKQIILFAICRCREEQQGLFADLPITLRAADFAAQFGGDIGGNVYRDLRAAMENLFERQAVIYDTDPETQKPRVTKTRWISQASYVDGAGHVQFIFAPAVIPFITRLEAEFTKYDLAKISGMTSVYAVRIYELLIQHLTIGKRSIEVAWLKESLQITDEYPRIASLKEKVIDVAVRQINEHTDLLVSYSQRKIGRTISHFDFTIKTKPAPKATTPSGKKQKKAVVDYAHINKFARPGESYDSARRRLLEEQHQQMRLEGCL